MRILVQYFILICIFLATKAWANDTKAKNETEEKSTSTSSSKNVDYDDAKESDIAPRIETVFDNPFITQSLNASSQVLNNAFDELMQGVFYRLLDNKFSQKITPKIAFNENLTRKVYSTGQGKYVIADRLVIGPGYSQVLTHVFGQLPLSIGVNTNIDLLNIHLRTNPQRIVESKTMPKWRYWFNIWFGIIPFLEYILPPSFDPNHLYDPLRQLETPFTFPTDRTSFEKMKSGSIQSYAYQGGIALPLATDGSLGPFVRNILSRLNLDLTLPYTLFVQGEYRISVLKKKENLAWVGISQSKRGGHSIAGFVGTTIYLLASSLGPLSFKGLPFQFTPLDVGAVESLIDKFDQIYEFDLREDTALKAYQQAIGGDLTFDRKPNLPKGVHFHFNQLTLSKQHELKNQKNLVLLYKEDAHRTITKSEIKIQDTNGEFFVLENTSEFDDMTFNILSGQQETIVSNEINLNVEKKRVPGFTLDKPKYKYIFHHSMKPYQLILKLQIKDRYADAKAFNQYIELIRKFTQLPLKEVPTIPLLTQKTVQKRKRSAFFGTPSESVMNLHATNTIVGKFNANALVVLDAPELLNIIKRNQEDLQEALYKSYDRTLQDDYAPQFEYLRSYISYPLRIANYKSANIDAYREIQNALKAIKHIQPDSDPETMLDAFHSFFRTDYPLQLISTLYRLSDIEKIARNATLYLEPSGDLEDESKKILAELNEKTFASETRFPELERYRIAKSKLNAFVPTSLKDERIAPKILKAGIDENHILKIVIDGKSKGAKRRFFLRLLTAGKFKLSQSELGNKLVELDPQQTQKNEPIIYASPLFRLDGPLYDFFKYEDLKENEEYSLIVSAADLQGAWSEEFKADLVFKDGKLTGKLKL